MLMELFWFEHCIRTEQGLAHSLMELSPSWEAANFAATQEIPSILWIPKVPVPDSYNIIVNIDFGEKYYSWISLII
jgi:hypothetical protein